ncbi:MULTISPECIES: hypothetical protein [unclassified Photobacterium]|uniref:hypothetical protein n=1 Tax=unclassified Photobacterium TaxID=2628852 RepID=UPI000D15C185|nr:MULTISPECIES: hypothetical protein [unclassified Photobacterium]PSV34919.1 hypothetical protein C9J44_14105 [Photobacterium sp. GB-27]PSV27179.1 hypothetical protein C9J42_09965 [Photobacterium sp. GB-56]PSV43013.1 hypothetical protein C9J46_12740 [Photobacterium sp. GB-36]PSV52028.1 hypothetical protein C9J45_12735 [Photobacterium sp. GB-1]PSV54956.1 hypothetical protein C9J43_16420 [Photobacterium sp. GB-3]
MVTFFIQNISVESVVLLLLAVILLFYSMQKENIWLSRLALILMVCGGAALINKQYQEYQSFSDQLNIKHDHSGFVDIP